jgi:hypothetical protein
MDWINSAELRATGVDIGTGKPLGNDSFVYTIPGGQTAIKIWHQLASRSATLGGWPILCGPTANLDRIDEGFSDQAETIEQALLKVPSLPPLQALKSQRSQQHEQTMEFLRLNNPGLYETLGRAQDQTRDRETIDINTWQASPMAPARQLHTPFDYKGKPIPECILAIIRSTEPANIPIHLHFGGFNDCPSSEIHVAFLRDWNKRYGAVPAAITTDVIELMLPQPIMDKAEAVRVAEEQYEYCSDIVDQGTQTVEKLAQEIWGSSSWFFWWD